MAFKLDDILNEKKGPPPALDLSKARMQTKEDFDKVFEKVPDSKIKPEKVRLADCTVSGAVHFRSSRVERQPVQFEYPDPTPISMAGVNLDDLCNVDISWRMLTMARPKNKQQEEYFSKLVSLSRSRRDCRKAHAGLPVPQLVPRSRAAKRGKGQAVEMRFTSCRECHEELCQGACKEYNYDCYSRLIVDEKDEKQDAAQGISAFINGTPGAAAARKQKTGARKPGVPRFRRKRRRKRRPVDEPDEETTDADAARRGLAALALEKGAAPALAPPADSQTRLR
ncbi:uncharacterized protein LOC119105435 [Pollicipes pollicipes]|uniref:uncharacterized protein LOC119105435 n=1 Tax=Pollicipes pollicipes TaxID=41117 RepID=UPI001884C010|nr:uncharacterized protein LOC119105435 [Pollicipes pollicipes]